MYTVTGALVTPRLPPIATSPASFTWNARSPDDVCTRNIPGCTVIGDGGIATACALTNAFVSERMLKTATSLPPIMMRSPTLSSVKNLVPTPVSVAEPAAIDAVPVAANGGFAFIVSLAVPVGTPMPIVPLLATANLETLPVRKLIDPPGAMLLIRYSCVALLNP